jgi:PAS domain S-box-containing protein
MAGWILFILAAVVLLGWAFDLRGLQSFVPGTAGIKANSAVAMMLASVALLRRNHRELPFLSIAVFLISALSLSEYVWDRNFGIDELLFHDTNYMFHPGRMSQYTSIGYMLLGLSLLPMNSRHRVLRQLSIGLGILTGALGALAIVSHAYDTHAMNLLRPHLNVSVPSALGFLIGAIGVQYANPSEGIVRLLHAHNAGGAMLRRLLPTGILLTLLLGYAVRDAQIHYRWESGFSLALVGLGVGACLITGIVLTAVALERQDLSRRESESLLMLAAKAAPVMIWMSSTDKLCTYVNEPWLDFTGRSMESELGTGWADDVHPEDLQRSLDIFTQSFDLLEEFRMEHRLRRYDGEYRWVLEHGVPRFDQDGSFVGYIGIAVDVTDRKRTEEALHDRERALTEAQRLAGVGSWEWEPHTDTVTWSKELYHLMGIDPTLPAPSYEEHAHLYAAEGWERLQRAVQGALQTGSSYELDLEVVRPESIAKWEIARGEPVRDKSGQIIGLRGTVQDITERKHAEEALLGMSRKLIDAHEQERTRIGRELHDDIVQRIALLTIELQQWDQQLPDSAVEVHDYIDQVRQRLLDMARDIQALSHRLHSSKLEYLGLAAAAKGFCNELSEQQKVEIDFTHKNIPKGVPKEISLCLFRVLQEALRNAVKHSGERQFAVELHGTEREIQLTVRDQGVGFDPHDAINGHGLGLISMRERMQLVGGEIFFRSQPGSGTTIRASVPFSSGSDSVDVNRITAALPSRSVRMQSNSALPVQPDRKGFL